MALVLDGTLRRGDDGRRAGHTMTGDKRFLGFVETDTENEQVLTPFLRSLVERGLDVSQGLPVIVDGGKGLRAAVRHAFRHRALVQRCQWHKRENVVSYLAKRQPVWRQRLQRAYNRPEYDEAPFQSPTEDRNLVWHETDVARLGVYDAEDDDGLESTRHRRWQNSSQRTSAGATALLDIEPRLRKVMGYRHLPRLRRIYRVSTGSVQ